STLIQRGSAMRLLARGKKPYHAARRIKPYEQNQSGLEGIAVCCRGVLDHINRRGADDPAKRCANRSLQRQNAVRGGVRASGYAVAVDVSAGHSRVHREYAE